MNKKKEENKTHAFTHIEQLLEKMAYGSITLIVQDGYVVQIEQNEKIRLK